uniref:Uncharacterized protein n=1 Tax=Nelumbo nucifera TaxID=4432 RepID=A0A822ZKS1_NELNU|nr:TPA_asm: hypothetical protein HUJ06_016611 [Nelumbo nucifera]
MYSRWQHPSTLLSEACGGRHCRLRRRSKLPMLCPNWSKREVDERQSDVGSTVESAKRVVGRSERAMAQIKSEKEEVCGCKGFRQQPRKRIGLQIHYCCCRHWD